MKLTRAAAIIALATSACLSQTPEPWTASEVVEPAALASALESGRKPLIISVAFPVLYRQRHIAGAVDAGAASKPEGIEAIRKIVDGKPKDTEIVVYCGCCPMERCPNVRPAFRVLKEMGYRNVRVLHLPTNSHVDWYAKNYPSEAGTAPESK